ncbi:MAG TPA: hypothetical protein HA252_03520 [Candidatus Diapherotrites archaeon]|uniref:Class III signal peptide-containing protein n=1 Tax=Candidatus Iainarchaeum sp. TaxID=3101447 RepID=A0A7J4JKK3_9ARCH|nr:hypothetical protein [Candidatus Diapherotrites archaeon]
MGGQLSVEFIVVSLIVLLIFSASVFVYGERQQAFEASKKLLEAKQLALHLARTMNDVYLAGEGASTRIFLPKPFDFNVLVSGRYLELSFDNQFVDAPLVSAHARINSFSAGGFVPVAYRDENVVVG